MRTIKYAIEAAISLAVLLGLMYAFTPALYAHVWQLSQGYLPVTERIKQECPSCYFREQTRELNQSREELRQQRKKALTISQTTEQRRARYQQKHELGEQLLTDARAAYQANPEASYYMVAGKRLDRARFDAQVRFTSTEVTAVKKAHQSMGALKGREQQIWGALAQASASFELKQSELDMARFQYETNQIISDLDFDIDGLQTNIKKSAASIRDLDELMSDMDVDGEIATLDSMLDQKVNETGGLSAAALEILAPAPSTTFSGEMH